MFKEAGAGFLALMAAAVFGLVFALLVAAMYLFGFGWFSNATANFRGNVQVQNQTKGNGSYRIATYEHFFDLCASVQTRENVLSNVLAEMKTASADNKQQLQTVILANQNERAELINQYNADAAKSYTQGQFRASNLPYHLDVNETETQCAV